MVADEVRILAQCTQDSAQEIQDMVELLQENTDSAVAVMDTCLEQTKVSVKEAELTGEAIKNIAESVASLASLNEQIVNATVDQVTINIEIGEHTTEISEVARQMAVSQSSSMVPSSDGLVKISCELQALVGKFKLVESATGTDANTNTVLAETEEDILF